MATKRENIYKGFPSDIHGHDSRGFPMIASEFGLANKSKSHTFLGNLTGYELLAPASVNFLVLKGLTMLGDGNTGTVKVLRGSNSVCILPLYMSAQVRSSPSSGFNLVLNVNEKVLITSTGRGDTSETFVGISYLEFSPSDYLI